MLFFISLRRRYEVSSPLNKSTKMTINCLALKSANWRTNIKKYRKFIHTTCIKIYFSNWQKQQNFLKSCDTVEHAYSSLHANQWFIIPLKEILFDVLTSATSEKNVKSCNSLLTVGQLIEVSSFSWIFLILKSLKSDQDKTP